MTGPMTDPDDITEIGVEDAHAWLASLDHTFMWAGMEIKTPLGRRRAARWLIDQIQEIQAFLSVIKAYESWAKEAVTAADFIEQTKQPRPQPAVASRDLSDGESLRAVPRLEGTDEFNRYIEMFGGES